MSAPEYDVYVCYGPPGETLARALVDGLRGRGFRVFAAGPADAAAPDPSRFRLIETTPDFVVLLPTATLDGLASDLDPVRVETAHAVRHRRNIVQVRMPGEASDAAERALADLFALRRSHALTYDALRPRESIATVAHRLSSDGTVDERRIMRRAKWFFSVAAVVLLAGVAVQEIPRLIEQWSRPRLLAAIPPFAISWAAIGQRTGPGGLEHFAIDHDAAVANGDRVRVAFCASADGFAYVVSRGANGDVSVLFPTDAVRGASRVEAGKVYFAPVGTGWMAVDDQSAGGSVYLIAGYDPLHNLEELLEQPDGSASPAGRRQLLDSTVSGLLDGKHGATERRVWTGRLHPIDPDLKPASGPGQASVTLDDGTVVVRPLAVQAGLVSSSVEIKLQPR